MYKLIPPSPVILKSPNKIKESTSQNKSKLWLMRFFFCIIRICLKARVLNCNNYVNNDCHKLVCFLNKDFVPIKILKYRIVVNKCA